MLQMRLFEIVVPTNISTLTTEVKTMSFQSTIKNKQPFCKFYIECRPMYV